MKPEHLIYLSSFLFCVGIAVVITRRNAIMILLGIELMLNAANLNIVVFDQHRINKDGQLFALFVIVVAVCEAAVGMAIILKVFHHYKTSVPDQLNDLKEK